MIKSITLGQQKWVKLNVYYLSFHTECVCWVVCDRLFRMGAINPRRQMNANPELGAWAPRHKPFSSERGSFVILLSSARKIFYSWAFKMTVVAKRILLWGPDNHDKLLKLNVCCCVACSVYAKWKPQIKRAAVWNAWYVLFYQSEVILIDRWVHEYSTEAEWFDIICCVICNYVTSVCNIDMAFHLFTPMPKLKQYVMQKDINI